MDLVWFARGGENEELRHSIRSVTQNLPHGRVWVIGHPPAWYSGQAIRPRRGRDKHHATAINMRMAIMSNRISDPFIYLNDDMFLFKSLDAMPTLNAGPLEAHLNRGVDSRSFAGGRATLDLLQAKGYQRPLSFELHVPLVIHKAPMSEALRLIDGAHVEIPWKRTIYGAFAGLTGRKVKDVKVADPNEVPKPTTWLSTNDESFAGAAGRLVCAAFPTPSPYEHPPRRPGA